MRDSESPRTPFELLYTRWEEAPERKCLDAYLTQFYFFILSKVTVPLQNSYMTMDATSKHLSRIESLHGVSV